MLERLCYVIVEGLLECKKESLSSSKEEARKLALAAESKKNQDRAAALAIKNAPVAEVAEPAADETAETAAEGTSEETAENNA